MGLFMASPAAAQDYPVPNPICVLSDTTVAPGDTITVSGFNWLPNSNVLIQFFSDPVVLGTAQTDDDGEFSTAVQIPSDATAGQHTIRVTGRDQNGELATADCPLQVVAAPAPGPGGVAFTGTNVSLGLLILGALVIAGLGLVVASRRKKVHAGQ
ncbi:MAG: LPXTG cell wall anchor domain-containing protein [Actinomycetota bacterium]